MIITNDTISFDDNDFAELSDFAKKALGVFVGEKLAFKDVFADTLNKQVDQAKSVLVAVTGHDPKIENIVRKLAAAKQADLDNAKPIIDQLTTALDAVVAPSPVAFLPSDLTTKPVSVK